MTRPGTAFAPTTVLVVEDEPLQRLMIVDLLADAGYSTIEAMDAEDAVRILEERTDIHVVFADIDMPNGLDGMKLAAAIRDRWPPIELIIISGRIQSAPKDMPARSVFFSKPYKQDRVVDAVRSLAKNNENDALRVSQLPYDV